MDILKDPNAIIVLVIMVIGGLKWFFDSFKSSKRDPDEPSEDSYVDLYEETRQQIQERQARQYPSRQEAQQRLEEYAPEPSIFEPVSTLPPILSAPPPIPRPARSARPKPTRPPALSSAEQAALKRVQTHGMGGHSQRKRATRSPVRRLLSSPTAARDAIVLREILGPPKGAM